MAPYIIFTPQKNHQESTQGDLQGGRIGQVAFPLHTGHRTEILSANQKGRKVTVFNNVGQGVLGGPSQLVSG